MNFNIGDKVRFLNEKGEGVISKFVNKTTVSVTIEDGFEIPCLINNLVAIHDEKAPIKKEVVTPVYTVSSNKSEVPDDDQEAEEGIYIAFAPVNEKELSTTDFNVWLINHTNYQILFTYSIFQDGNLITLETGGSKAFENYLLETIERKVLEDFLNFKVDVIFYNEKEHSAKSPVSEIMKLKPVKLVRDNVFIKNNLLPEKALIITVSSIHEEEKKSVVSNLNSIDLSQILFQKKSHSDTKKRSKPHAVNNGMLELEIDLHIEELLDNYSGMSNGEIIQYQLQYFQKHLDKAIAEHYRKLVVIHGIGNGRLKQEVRILASSYEKIRVQDASFSKYGFGATEIVIS